MGKFHGTITPTTPSGSRKVTSIPPADLLAEHPLRRRRVVIEHVANVAGFPARLRDRMPRVHDLEQRQLLDVVTHGRGKRSKRVGPRARRTGSPRFLGCGCVQHSCVDLGQRRVFNRFDDGLVCGVDERDRRHFVVFCSL
jgi:hypothetical protein